MKPTIKDVARLAGTSTGTVSRVLNRHPAVAATTRARVEAAIEQLGFQADLSARTLAKARRTVALVQPFDADYRPFYAQLTRAFLRNTDAQGWRNIQIFPDEVLGSRADSVVFLRDDVPERTLERLLARRLPVAVMGYSDHVPYVCTKDEEGIASSTRLLRDTGHWRIAYLGWVVYPDGSYSPRGRGYERVIAEPPALHEPIFLGGDHTPLDAYRAVTKAWSRRDRFDGLVCSTDEAALGALAALEDLNVRVPGEVSVVGFDGLQGLPRVVTTVAQDFAALAGGALELVGEEASIRSSREHWVEARLVRPTTTVGQRLW